MSNPSIPVYHPSIPSLYPPPLSLSLSLSLSLVVTLLKLIVPTLINLSLGLEKYHPRTQNKVKIARTAVFYAASLIIFLSSVYHVASECMDVSVNVTHNTSSDYCYNTRRSCPAESREATTTSAD